jgi:predicted Zn finger-like uncharacterized protein
MTNAQLTRCPQCQTFFRVTPSQLKKAKGKVRCGSCSHVFDARGHLIGAMPMTADKTAATKISARPSAIKTPPSVAAPPRSTSPPQFIDSIVDDRSRYTNLDHLAPIQIPGELDLDLDIDNDPFFSPPPTAAQHAEKKPVGADHYEDTQSKAAPATRAELAGIAALFEEANEKITQPPVSELDEEIILNGGVVPAMPDFDPSELPSAATFKSSTIRAPVDDNPDSFQLETDEPAFEPEPIVEKPRRRAKRKKEVEMPYSLRSSYTELEIQPRPLWLHALLITVLLVLLASLFLQFVMNRHVQLVHRFPSLANGMTQFCAHLPCHYTGQRDVSKIQLINRDVRSHPTAKNALLISVSFVNQAGSDQPYPDILLTMSNLSGELVARRQFSPPEYLDKLYNQFLLMESGTPVHVTLAVIDPGEDAINFEFSFH